MDAAPPPSPWWSWSRLREVDRRILDPLMAAALLAIGAASLATSATDDLHPNDTDVLAWVLTVVGFGVLALRSRAPLAVLGVTLVATGWYSWAEYGENGLPIAVMIALYTVGSLEPPRRSAVGALAVAAVIAGLALTGSQGLDLTGAVGNLAVFGIAYAIGRYVRVRWAYTEQLELRAAEAEATRRRDAERAVADERLRIARELHDVVAHAMSVVAVQSGVAAHVIDAQPDQARAMVEAINGVSREALVEMRRMLGVLRAEGTPDEAQMTTAPSLEQLPSLVASVDGTGVTVHLAVDGEPGAMTPALDLTAFRIVQESLTNVVKHAGPAQATVRVRYGDEALVLEVVDDGRGAATELTDLGGGHGLVGMQERVELFGGTLAAGPRPGGGFAVVATLPYPAAVVA